MAASNILHGEFFDGVSAAAHPVSVTLSSGGELHVRGARIERRVAFGLCLLPPAVAHAPRTIELPDGAIIETTDVGVLETWEGWHNRSRAARLVLRLESRWRYVAMALGVLVLVAVSAYVWGLPLAARGIAFGLPAPVDVLIGRQAQPVVERELGLRPSRLAPERQDEIRSAFADLAAEAGSPGFEYELQFRDAPFLGPNALALPSGTILVTDQIVALAQSDQELLAVLAHEITHVEQRHALRSALQASGAGFLLGIVLGDLSTVSSLGASVPVVLAQAGYSRDFEREADRGAADICRRRGWGTRPLSDMLRRLGEASPGSAGLSWIASHPDTSERIRALGD